MLKLGVVGLILAMLVVIMMTIGKQPAPLNPEQIESIRSGFVDFLVEQVEKEKQRKVSNITINEIVQKGARTVEIRYSLEYNEYVEGQESVNYTLESEALLNLVNGNEWSVDKLTHRNQNLNFQEGAIIKGQPEN